MFQSVVECCRLLQTRIHAYTHTNTYTRVTRPEHSCDMPRQMCGMCSVKGCSVLQCVAVCCSVWQCVAVCCSVLQCVAVCCSVLPCVAVCCGVLRCVAVCCSVLPRVAVCCAQRAQLPPYTRVSYLIYTSTWQCVAVCCSVLQCVAVCCSVLQCVAVCCLIYTGTWHTTQPPDCQGQLRRAYHLYAHIGTCTCTC